MIKLYLFWTVLCFGTICAAYFFSWLFIKVLEWIEKKGVIK